MRSTPRAGGAIAGFVAATMGFVQESGVLFGVGDVGAGDDDAARFVHNLALSFADFDTIGGVGIVVHCEIIGPRDDAEVKCLRAGKPKGEHRKRKEIQRS